jgi:hypothetical protein
VGLSLEEARLDGVSGVIGLMLSYHVVNRLGRNMTAMDSLGEARRIPALTFPTSAHFPRPAPQVVWVEGADSSYFEECCRDSVMGQHAKGVVFDSRVFRRLLAYPSLERGFPMTWKDVTN